MKKILDNLYMFESKTNVLLYKNKKKCILIDTGKSVNLKSEIKEYIISNFNPISNTQTATVN